MAFKAPLHSKCIAMDVDISWDLTFLLWSGQGLTLDLVRFPWSLMIVVDFSNAVIKITDNIIVITSRTDEERSLGSAF